jgi:hypothetical protein
MKRATRAMRAAGAIVLGCGLGGCGWEEIDALAPGEGGSGYDAGAGSLDAGSTPDVTTDDQASAEAGSSDGDLGETGSPAGDGDMTSSLPCSTGAPLREWTFDTDSEGWVFLMNPGVSGGVSWTGAAGDPSPGTLDVDVTSVPPDAGTANGGWVEFQATPLGNLSGRVLSAWVWLEAGPTPNLKIFVQTGSQFVWADNGTVHLQPHVWTCVSLAVSSPAYTNGPDYDPQNVVRLGFEMLSPEPFHVYVDSVGYQ